MTLGSLSPDSKEIDGKEIRITIHQEMRITTLAAPQGMSFFFCQIILLERNALFPGAVRWSGLFENQWTSGMIQCKKASQWTCEMAESSASAFFHLRHDVEDLRRGAWAQPEPPRKDMPTKRWCWKSCHHEVFLIFLWGGLMLYFKENLTLQLQLALLYFFQLNRKIVEDPVFWLQISVTKHIQTHFFTCGLLGPSVDRKCHWSRWRSWENEQDLDWVPWIWNGLKGHSFGWWDFCWMEKKL